MAEENATILIIEDDEDIAEVLVILLKGFGYDAVHAPDGEAALHFLRATSRLPDVILLDLMMPVMDGEQFRIEQLRDTRFAHIPVVVMSGAGHPEHKVSSLRPNAYLVKPVDAGTLSRALSRLM
jgi:CheY-like chemotaxis protein